MSYFKTIYFPMPLPHFLIKGISILISFFLQMHCLSTCTCTTVHEAEFVTQLLYAELQPVVEEAKG